MYCAWVLSFPVFPTQDGPIHLYYAKIFSNLYSGPSVYSEYFAIRHPLPPYAVHYLLLVGLFQLVSAVTAEKLVICLILVLTSFGFLHLVKSVAGDSPVLALIGIPLSLNWTVGMGFHNYGLSLGLSLFAISFWVRARTRDRNGARVAFVCLTFADAVHASRASPDDTLGCRDGPRARKVDGAPVRKGSRTVPYSTSKGRFVDLMCWFGDSRLYSSICKWNTHRAGSASASIWHGCGTC